MEADPSSTSLSLDEDPVAQVYGIDRDGHVRGFGVGISKASLSASAPAKENFRQATQKCILVENRLEDLENQVNQLTKHMNLMVTQMAIRMAPQQARSNVIAESTTSKVSHKSIPFMWFF